MTAINMTIIEHGLGENSRIGKYGARAAIQLAPSTLSIQIESAWAKEIQYSMYCFTLS